MFGRGFARPKTLPEQVIFAETNSIEIYLLKCDFFFGNADMKFVHPCIFDGIILNLSGAV